MKPHAPVTGVGLLKDGHRPLRPPAPRRIFVNRNLRMDTVKAIGFDMDYTIARYSRERLEELAHKLTIEKLIRSRLPRKYREASRMTSLL
ncbi:MAG: 5'-nucleotidase domain-containing protein [Myxococcota bacterium]